MRLAMGCLQFSSIGGTQTYTVTVAEQLQRLGHEVLVFTERTGEMSDLARARGIQVESAERALPERLDGIISRDAVTAATLAARYPGVPLVFVAPSEVFDFQLPPLVPGAVSTVVVLDDRLRDRIGALAMTCEIVRLRHPIDTDRLRPRAPVRERARRVLMLGNYVRGARRALLEEACRELGLETVQVGRHGHTQLDPAAAINDADIVVGKSRALLDGMACGRAAYAYDIGGCDGWVTPERYEVLEADGFGGRADSDISSPERLVRDLSGYRPEMGLANRDLVLANHAAGRHAVELLKLLERHAGAAAAPSEPLQEVARLARALAGAESRAWAASLEAELAGERALAAESRSEDLLRKLERASSHIEELKRTRRYRFAAALAKPLDAARAWPSSRKNGADEPRGDHGSPGP
jgi:hypothetical protein